MQMIKTKDRKGFSLVELMVVIAIVAILAAIAVPAYSNYIMKTKFQDEIGKMDNYRKAIAIFIQEAGVTSDDDFQSEIANVKDNYLGDDNVAIMSELKSNNGRLLAYPVINGTTYQIALTPRINSREEDGVTIPGTLINWECDIRNETDESAPPSGAMPNGCNPKENDLNDDQVGFNDAVIGYEQSRTAALTSASTAYTTLRETLLTENDEYQGYLEDINTFTAELNTFDNQISGFNDALDLKNNEIRIANENYNNAVTNAATSRQKADEDIAPGDAYWNNLANSFDDDAADYLSQITTLNSQKNTIESDLETAENNRNNASDDLTTATTNRNNLFTEIDNTAKADSNYVTNVKNANETYTASVENLEAKLTPS